MESYCPYSWMNTEGGRRRRRRRRKKVNKVHGGESSNSSRRQKMAAQLTVRKHSPHCHAGGVSACVVWMLNKQIKKRIKSSLENGVFQSSPLRKKSNGASKREKVSKRQRKGEKRCGGAQKGQVEESEGCPRHYGTQSMKSHRLKR